MTIPRLSAAGRFDPACLFRPASVAAIGRGGADVAARLAMGGFKGRIDTVLNASALGAAPDLAVIATPADEVIPTMEALAALGCFAAIVPGAADGLAAASRRTGVRVLGPYAFGIAVSSAGLDATAAHIPIPPGRLALVSQSAGLTRTLIDWAAPNGVGFSHVIGVGGNADLGFATALDWLSQDAAAGAILLEISHLNDPRAFLSAARAASRVRPVVAFRSGPWAPDPSGRAAAVFEAALRRAGVLSVGGLEDMLAAAETLSRTRPIRRDTLAIQAADPSVRGLGIDAAVRLGVALAAEGEAAGGVLAIGTPGEALELVSQPPVPVLYCAMGETTGASRRRRMAEAGATVFASPEQAVRGFAHLVQDRRNRAAARELPDGALLTLAADQETVRGVLAGAAGALAPDRVRAVFDAYGIAAPGIAVFDDAVFGPAIVVGGAVDLPPLNLALARGLAARAGQTALTQALVRVSQLVVDFPAIASLDTTDGSLVLRPAGDAAGSLAIAPYPAELVRPWTNGDLHLIVRPIRPEDAEAHAAFFRRLSPTDVRFRFFSAMQELSPERLARLTQIDYDREMAFVACREDTGDTVAVARLVQEAGGTSGEFAIVVQADMKGRGLATHMMQRLIAWARDRGLRAVVGQILSDNAPMLAFIRHLGFEVHRLRDDPEVMEARLVLV